jgi:hypothetical protein
MEPTILDNIPFELDLEALKKTLRVRESSSLVADLEQMAADAVSVARPKAMYKICLVELQADNRVVVDEVTFTSRVLRVNLEDTHRVFPYVVTCGIELDAWAQGIDGTLRSYWADAMAGLALASAYETLATHLADLYGLGQTSEMNPGSLPDWPLMEQRILFRLLGDPQSAIGVSLSESYLMRPLKSVSGLLFVSEEEFVSCQLCPREDCIGRRASYDQALHESKYQA